MRSSQKPNRSRGKSNRKNVGNSVNRVYESSGPEGKVRGTPQQIIDKYIALARDSQTSGDRVAAENFLQHAEHYTRLLTAAQAASNERREQANNAAQSQPQQKPQPQGQPDQQPSNAQAQDAQAAQPQPAAQHADAPQPVDVNGMATFDGGEKTQIVETPEGERKRGGPRARKPRTPKAAAADQSAEVAEAKPASKTAEEPVTVQDATPESA